MTDTMRAPAPAPVQAPAPAPAPPRVGSPSADVAAELRPLGDYLRARRSVVQPEWVGITREKNRRVEGLRREEVARLAAISPEYYLRLEQGRDKDPSEQVLAAIARALLIDENTLDYLQRIVRLHPFSSSRPAPSQAGADLALRDVVRMLDEWSTTPAFVITSIQDVVAGNAGALELAGGRLRPGANLVELAFSAEARAYEEWEARASVVVGALRYHGDPYDPAFRRLVGRMSVRDVDFRRVWARHEVDPALVGRISLVDDAGSRADFAFQNFEIPGARGLTVTVLRSVDEETADDGHQSDYRRSVAT